MINNFNFTADYVVWTFIVDDKRNDQIKVSIRSRGPVINAILENYGGGGHAMASGARLTKKEDVDKLIEDFDKLCKEYK